MQPDVYDPNEHNALFAKILSFIDNTEERYHEDKAESQEFRASTVENFNKVNNRLDTVNGNIARHEREFVRIKSDEPNVIRWADLWPNKGNWKIYIVVIVIFMANQSLSGILMTAARTFARQYGIVIP